MTESEIRANNARIIAERNARDQVLRERLSKMKYVNQEKPKRGKKGSGDQVYTSVRLKTELQRKIVQEAQEYQLSRSDYIKIVFERWWSAPAEQKLIGKVLQAIREYEDEKNGSVDHTYTVVRIETEIERRIAKDARELDLSLSRYIEIVFRRWWADPDEREMIGRILAAIHE